MGGFHGGHFHSSGRTHSSSRGFHTHGISAYHHHNDNETPSFLVYLVSGILIILSGIILGLTTVKYPAQATVTTTKIVPEDYQDKSKSWIYSAFLTPYETYTFSYEFMGKTYTGTGDDDLIVVNGEYHTQVNVGEKYPVYCYLFSPSTPYFESGNAPFITLSAIFSSLGVVLIFVGYVTTEKEKERAKRIAQAYPKKPENHENTLAHPKEIVITDGEGRERNYISCPRCAAVLKKDATCCPYCGISLLKENPSNNTDKEE